MPDKTLPQNDLPDLQTKNPNPPDLDDSDESPVADESPFVAPPNFRGRPARHGLRSRRLFIAPEDVDRFDRFRRNTIRELSPIDHTEHFIVEAIVTKRWLILHCDEAEAAAMRNAFVASEHLTAAQMESNAKDAPRDDDERFDHAMAATCTDEKVHLVLRYRTIHERGLVRFETMLRQYRALCEAREIADARMRPANPPYNPPSDSPEVLPLKSPFPTISRKPNIADALANLSRRNPSPANPSRNEDLRANQTKNPNAPDETETLALRARILEDIKNYYAHLKSQTPESDGVPTENPLEQSDAAPES